MPLVNRRAGQRATKCPLVCQDPSLQLWLFRLGRGRGGNTDRRASTRHWRHWRRRLRRDGCKAAAGAPCSPRGSTPSLQAVSDDRGGLECRGTLTGGDVAMLVRRPATVDVNISCGNSTQPAERPQMGRESQALPCMAVLQAPHRCWARMQHSASLIPHSSSTLCVHAETPMPSSLSSAICSSTSEQSNQD